jgi:hypothetical protein
MESLFLSKDEVAELTGYKLPAHQGRWLKEHGWVFERNATNRPIVGRDYARSRLGGARQAAAVQSPSSTPRPNFGALTSR